MVFGMILSRSEPHLLRSLTSACYSFLPASLADLVRTDPFPFDGPRAKASVVRIIASEMTVLDEPSTSMTTMEVNDFKLVHRQPVLLPNVLVKTYLAHFE